ncbi:hypothetical protein [Solilutibacter silvestris]|uniref:hypothetical protein n=1 Tax=Solilutibacter silvestris TaxID=1645665 RepID=UPI00101ADA17|nr:hypothetical protein [Lysobacter silvestris]
MGSNLQGVSRRDKVIAAICALLVHALFLSLLLCNASNGRNRHTGNSIGHGDSLVVYPIVITSPENRLKSTSPTPVPIIDDVSKAKPSDSAAKQVSLIKNLDLSRSIRQVELNAHTAAPETPEPQPHTKKAQVATRNTPLASSGGNTGNDLLASYQAAMRVAIFKTWQGLSKNSYPSGCTIHLSQNPGGAVTAASAATCGLSKEDQLQLEAAALMAQPMPYAGYESVFSTEMDLTL